MTIIRSQVSCGADADRVIPDDLFLCLPINDQFACDDDDDYDDDDDDNGDDDADDTDNDDFDNDDDDGHDDDLFQ